MKIYNDVQQVKPYDTAGIKTGQVNQMFNRIVKTYDFFNHFFSAGLDKTWRRETIRRVVEEKPVQVLDLATGTGDMIVELLKQGYFEITGIDINLAMMEIARKKVSKFSDKKVEFMQGDIENLKLPDNSFDAVTIAFGIRNVSNIKKGLAEMYRIVKPDQKVFILELSIPSNWLFKKLYFMYLKGIIPLVGQIFSKDKNAYPYLSKSAMSFPAPGQFAEMIKKVGFREVCYDVFSAGIVALHVARK